LHRGNEGGLPNLRRRITAAASAQSHCRGGGCRGKPNLQAQRSNGGTTMTPEERQQFQQNWKSRCGKWKTDVEETKNTAGAE